LVIERGLKITKLAIEIYKQWCEFIRLIGGLRRLANRSARAQLTHPAKRHYS
jgi:hypothetical protein